MYIITDDLNHNGYFYPRIPEHRLLNENNDTKRICLAKTIEGCLTSFPRGGENLIHTLAVNMNVLKVFKIIPEKLKLKKQSIKNEYEIVQYVQDALITQECWITESFQVDIEDTFYIYCHSWEQDMIFDNTNRTSFTIIKELDYDILNQLMTNTYYSFTLENYLPLNNLTDYFNEHHIIYRIDKDNLLQKQTIHFKTNNKNLDISPFFIEWINIYKNKKTCI